MPPCSPLQPRIAVHTAAHTAAGLEQAAELKATALGLLTSIAAPPEDVCAEAFLSPSPPQPFFAVTAAACLCVFVFTLLPSHAPAFYSILQRF